MSEHSLPVQFPKDEILNDDDRLVRAFMTAEVTDHDGEIIPVGDIRRSLNIWMDRGGIVMDMHTNRQCGKALNWNDAVIEHEGVQIPAITVDYKIFKQLSNDDVVWKEILSGERKGVSYGGKYLEGKEASADPLGNPGVRLNGFETYEVSSVKGTANPLAMNTMINFLAKGSNDLTSCPTCKSTIHAPKNKAGVPATSARAATQDPAGVAKTDPQGDSQKQEADTMADEDEKKPAEEEKKKAEMPPAAPAAPAPAGDGMDARLQALETQMAQVLSLLQNKAASETEKQDDEDEKKPEEEEKKKADEEEEEKPSEEEKKKAEGEVEGEEVKLPKTPVGETDEGAKIETDKAPITEKRLGKVVGEAVKTEVGNVMKGLNVEKSTTPRPPTDVQKLNTGEYALKMMKEVRAGKRTLASYNMEVAGIKRNGHDERLRAFIQGV